MAKKRRVKNKFYFGEIEEEAVRCYVTATTQFERSLIYVDYLEYPLGKMVESIIRKYKLYRKDMTYEEIYNDTLSFLFSKADKFDPTKGHKAYSYFGTICKHYLMGLIIKDQKETTRVSSYEDIAPQLEDSIKLSYTINEFQPESNKVFKTLLGEIEELLKSGNLIKNERILGEALLDIFTNHDKIFQYGNGNKFNKNIIFLSLREITNLNTKEIRAALKKFKKIYKVIAQKTTT